MMDAAGNLYGTAEDGGPGYSGGYTGDGTVFEVAKGSSTITTLASFNGTDGFYPDGGLVLDAAGNLYGTAVLGGPGYSGASNGRWHCVRGRQGERHNHYARQLRRRRRKVSQRGFVRWTPPATSMGPLIKAELMATARSSRSPAGAARSRRSPASMGTMGRLPWRARCSTPPATSSAPRFKAEPTRRHSIRDRRWERCYHYTCKLRCRRRAVSRLGPDDGLSRQALWGSRRGGADDDGTVFELPAPSPTPLAPTAITPLSPNPARHHRLSNRRHFQRADRHERSQLGVLTLTDNGGPNLIDSGVTITLVSGTTYAIGGLEGLTTAEGEYTLTVNAADIDDQNGDAGTGSLSTAWLIDTTPPISTVNALPAQSASTSFTVSVTASDPSTAGETSSGVASIAIYDSVNGGRICALHDPDAKPPVGNVQRPGRRHLRFLQHRDGHRRQCTGDSNRGAGHNQGDRIVHNHANANAEPNSDGDRRRASTLQPQVEQEGQAHREAGTDRVHAGFRRPTQRRSRRQCLRTTRSTPSPPRRSRRRPNRSCIRSRISRSRISAAGGAVEISLGAKETFPTGGRITVVSGLTTAVGGTLTGPAVFAISKGGNNVASVRTVGKLTAARGRRTPAQRHYPELPATLRHQEHRLRLHYMLSVSRHFVHPSVIMRASMRKPTMPPPTYWFGIPGSDTR